MKNLKWVKNDLINARATVGMLKVKPENIYEFIDSSSDEIKEFDIEMQAKIIEYAKAGETVLIYAYIAGHGCANVRQYYLMNSSDPCKALYNIEEKLRQKSLCGSGLCFVFAVYDICRTSQDFEKIQ